MATASYVAAQAINRGRHHQTGYPGAKAELSPRHAPRGTGLSWFHAERARLISPQARDRDVFLIFSPPSATVGLAARCWQFRPRRHPGKRPPARQRRSRTARRWTGDDAGVRFKRKCGPPVVCAVAGNVTNGKSSLGPAGCVRATGEWIHGSILFACPRADGWTTRPRAPLCCARGALWPRTEASTDASLSRPPLLVRRR